MIPMLIHIYNNSIHQALNTSPAHVLMGIPPSAWELDVYNLLKEGEYFSEALWLRERAAELQKAYNLAMGPDHHSIYFQNIEKKMLNRHPHTRQHQFQIGDLVMVKRGGKQNKLPKLSPFMGPARVTALTRNSLIVQYVSNGYIRKLAPEPVSYTHLTLPTKA